MADFDNLTGDIDAFEDELINDDEEESILQPSEQYSNNNRPVIPSALREAEVQRREEQERVEAEEQNEDDDYDDNNGDDEGHIRGSTLSPDVDYEHIKKLWIQEINTDEILKYDDEIIPMLMEALPHQEEVIEQFQEQTHHNPSNASLGNVDSDLASLAASICKLDMDRMCFLLADLSRVRLGKIEKYPIHNVEKLDQMSEEEATYLSEYGKLFEQHMCRSVTDHIPKEGWKKLNEPSMIDRPNLDNYVFCRVAHEDGVIINDYKGTGIEIDDANEDEPYPHYGVGSCLFVRYGAIRDLVSEGKIDLIM